MMIPNEDTRPFDVDEQLGLCALFVSAPRRDLTYVKVVLESYEGVGVARTERPFLTQDRALLVLLLVPDFLDVARRLIKHFEAEVGLRIEVVDDTMREELRHDLLSRLDY